ncbi:helix-turn-helix domain-containing protein [Streptomyces argyrophyllae]|uniref:Helix-turn-helix domain-containing protein n=1 Tax=Streptomyces argyrophylli TaxID=2726118 RepID=A0A6M4PX74_9ACTN|nr:helix-turn-helix domain-containing protein [Streptomyces argyrophyllae]
MSLVLTTDTVPDQEKVAYWNDAVSRALVPVTVAPRDSRRFDGRIASDCLGYLRVSRMEADAGRVSRTPALIERSPEALVAVGLLVSGTATFLQDGRRAEMGGGDLVFYDTARPFSFTYPERFATHVFQLPRHVLGVSDGDIKRVTGTAIGTAHGLGSVLRPFLATLADAAPSYPAAVGHRLAGHVVDLFATLITDQTLRDPDDGRDHLVLSVRAHIDRKLGDPSLSPESIARAHHISVRYLHRLFEGEGITVSRLIQQRRLEACGRELARRGRVTPTVSAVARRWGFVNPAHFSRAFRAAYGLSPREWRTRHLERGEDEQPAGPALS